MNFFDSFKKSNLTYSTKSLSREINIDEINEGISQNDNFLFFRENELIKIYDRSCDHNLGKLFLKCHSKFLGSPTPKSPPRFTCFRFFQKGFPYVLSVWGWSC